MSTEPFRFIHAANLFVDHQLRDVGPLHDAARPIARDATRDAFRRVVDLTIEQDVDFLLLAGNTFDPRDRSLRAELALLEGFARLAEQQVAVFVLPGYADPPSAWRAIPGLPESVTVLCSASGSAVDVQRGEALLATVSAGLKPAKPAQEMSSRRCAEDVEARAGFLIEMHQLNTPESRNSGSDAVAALESQDNFEPTLPQLLGGRHCDYLALACGHNRQTVALGSGLAHSPGATQGLGRLQTGPHGCTRVDVDAEGAAQCTFLATAAVRWESLPLPVLPDITPDELIGKMRESLADCRPESSETLWLVNWSVPAGAAFGWLEDGAFEKTLAAALPRLPSHASVWLSHALEFSSVTRIEAAKPSEGRTLSDRYLQRLRDAHPLGGSVLEERFAEIPLHRDEIREHVRGLASGLDYRAVSRSARRHGLRWFAPPVEAST